MKPLLLISLLLCGLKLPAQLFIHGRVTAETTLRAIPWVMVRCGKQYTYTAADGSWELNIPRREFQLEFRHLNYESRVHAIPETSGDTLFVETTLALRIRELAAVNIQAGAPDTIVASEQWMIRDFCFQGDQLLLLTWERNPDKCTLRLADLHGMVRASEKVADVPLGFFTDIAGNVYLECRENTWQIETTDAAFSMLAVNEHRYYGAIRPLVGLSPEKLFGSTWRRDKPEFAYIGADRYTSEADTIIEISNKHLSDLYYSEYTFLPFRVKTELNRRCRRSGEDRYELAAQLTGFTRSLWWKTLYSPLFMVDTQAVVVDHYRDSLIRFDASGHRLTARPISFHHAGAYTNSILRDEISGEAYAVFRKNGLTWCERLDLMEGTTQRMGVLHYRYAEKLRIRGGIIYYLYRPFESSQNTFLYAERF